MKGIMGTIAIIVALLGGSLWLSIKQERVKKEKKKSEKWK